MSFLRYSLLPPEKKNHRRILGEDWQLFGCFFVSLGGRTSKMRPASPRWSELPSRPWCRRGVGSVGGGSVYLLCWLTNIRGLLTIGFRNKAVLNRYFWWRNTLGGVGWPAMIFAGDDQLSFLPVLKDRHQLNGRGNVPIIRIPCWVWDEHIWLYIIMNKWIIWIIQF